MRRAVTVLCSATLAIAGCGGDEHEAAPADTLVRASEATKKLGGHHVAMKVHMRFESLLRDRTFDITGTGDVDPRAYRARYRIDLSDLTGRGSPVGRDPGDAQVVAIERGPVLYVKTGALTGLLRDAGVRATWVEDDQSKVITSTDAALREAMSSNQENPGQLLDYLDAAQGRVERLGEATIDGVETTHYRGTCHLRRLGTGQAAVYRRGLQANASRVIRFTGKRTVPVEAWIDRRGAVRRVSLAYELVRNPSTGRRIDGSMKVTADLSGFGREVKAERPPEDDVISLQELVRLGE